MTPGGHMVSATFLAFVCAQYTIAQAVPTSPAPREQIEQTLERQGVDVDALRNELRQILLQQLAEEQAKSAARGGKKSTKGKPAVVKSEASESTEERLKRRAREIGDQIRERVYAELQRLIDQRLGPQLPQVTESVLLDGLDAKGKPVQIPIMVQMRPLRLLSEPANAEETASILSAEDFTLALYEGVPSPVVPLDDEGFWRIYTEENARAIKTEAKLLVSLKGGDWIEVEGTRPVANVVAVRGLDLDLGLKPNGNTTYDDTMYVIVDEPNKDTEVFEYRMTTESSSASKGVGRLASKQVIYVRGLHRGKDPAYRLKDDSAPGTRVGLEGQVAILGANLHSAYAKRQIDSATPLAPNVSLGCQVVATSKKDFEQSLIKLLDKKGIKEFPYTIIDGDELQVLESALRQKSKRSVLVDGIPRETKAALTPGS